MKKSRKEVKHPWDEFLNARAKAIIWLREEQHHTFERIAYDLSMDVHQAYSIYQHISGIVKD